MRENLLKKKLKNKKLTIGSWISFDYEPICEIMVNSSFDWLVIDMEHTAIDFKAARNLIQIIHLSGKVPLVRVGSNDPLIIKRVMDSGAYGVIIPMINTKEDAQKAVAAVYYPPKGKRGVGLYRAQHYGLGFEQYKQWLENECVVIVQIEHIDAVKNLEQILSVEGVDGFIVGPYDLSGSLNQPGNFEHPDVKAALDKIREIMKTSTKPGGYHVVHSKHDDLALRINEGYKFIAYGDDMIFFSEKLAKETKFINKIKK